MVANRPAHISATHPGMAPASIAATADSGLRIEPGLPIVLPENHRHPVMDRRHEAISTMNVMVTPPGWRRR